MHCALLQPVYQVGLPGTSVSNIETNGANWITRGRMEIVGQAANISASEGATHCMGLNIHIGGLYRLAVPLLMFVEGMVPLLTLHVGGLVAARRNVGTPMQQAWLSRKMVGILSCLVWCAFAMLVRLSRKLRAYQSCTSNATVYTLQCSPPLHAMPYYAMMARLSHDVQCAKD
jgi:hypothetical protein